MDDMTETTPADFALFVSECERWFEIYGHKCWQVYFQHQECDGMYGSCETNLSGRVATIRFAKRWPVRDYSPEQIKHTAFHEATELLTAPMVALAGFRYATESKITGANHAIIRILEHVLYPLYSKEESHGMGR